MHLFCGIWNKPRKGKASIRSLDRRYLHVGWILESMQQRLCMWFVACSDWSTTEERDINWPVCLLQCPNMDWVRLLQWNNSNHLLRTQKYGLISPLDLLCRRCTLPVGHIRFITCTPVRIRDVCYGTRTSGVIPMLVTISNAFLIGYADCRPFASPMPKRSSMQNKFLCIIST